MTVTHVRNPDNTVTLENTGTDPVVCTHTTGPVPADYSGPVSLAENGGTETLAVSPDTQVCFDCLPDAIVPCIDRASTLLPNKIGFGAGATGGTEFVLITSLTDSSFIDALTAGNKYICFDPSLDGQVWQAPILPVNDPNNTGVYIVGENTTIDGRDAHVTLQLGTPETVDYQTAPNYKITQLIWEKGNFIGYGFTIKGDLKTGIVQDTTQSLNGWSDAEIWGGSDYYFSNVTLENMSDEALSVYHNNGGQPDNITFTKLHFMNNKNDSIVGSQFGTYQGNITQAYNWSEGAVEGRAPGIYYNMNAHVFGNVAEDYNQEGIFVGNNGEVISEYNVLDPGCRPQTNILRYGAFYSSGWAGVAGKLNDTGTIVIPGDTSQGCGFSQDQAYSEPLANLFTIPYSYTNEAGTTEATIRAYVAANAGADKVDRSQTFCEVK